MRNGSAALHFFPYFGLGSSSSANFQALYLLPFKNVFNSTGMSRLNCCRVFIHPGSLLSDLGTVNIY